MSEKLFNKSVIYLGYCVAMQYRLWFSISHMPTQAKYAILRIYRSINSAQFFTLQIYMQCLNGYKYFTFFAVAA